VKPEAGFEDGQGHRAQRKGLIVSIDPVTAWTFTIVSITFAIYIGIAIWSRAGTTGEFYVAGKHVPPIANGMATAADWMSAASFISMAGIISFVGRDGSVYLMGWTGGYVLLALLLAPYLRKFGKFTVPDFVGERYYSKWARLVALLCAIFVSFTYVAGQMRGVGIVFSHFLSVDIESGVVVGMAIVFCYAVLGGMKGITYTQVAQYCVLIFAYLVPAIYISILITGHVIPQIGFGAQVNDGSGQFLLVRLDAMSRDLGFAAYTSGVKSTIDVFCITMALMVGTAGLPHVIIRFFTVPGVRDARRSAGWALLFIAILYTTAPAVAAFARANLLRTVTNTSYTEAPAWFKHWETTGLIAWMDKDGDGVVRYAPGHAFTGKPVFSGERGEHNQRLIANDATDTDNELYVDRDIMVLANPEIANLPPWIIALVAAGGLAAALSTAAGLLLVISTSISHDLMKNILVPKISERTELFMARAAAGAAVLLAGHFGVHPPGFVAQVVAFAFGLAASSFFPVIVMGIFSKRMNREGAISGMISGIAFTASYIIYFKFVNPAANTAENWWFGISPEGIGALGMVVNFVVAIIVCSFTAPPPPHIQGLIENIRVPRGATETLEIDL
jgi:cation/acetate symporter